MHEEAKFSRKYAITERVCDSYVELDLHELFGAPLRVNKDRRLNILNTMVVAYLNVEFC